MRRVRLSYWRNPRTGAERVYLRGLGETLWCDAEGLHTPAGPPSRDLEVRANLAIMAEVDRYARHRAWRIILGRAWLRLRRAWRRWVLGRGPEA